MFVMCILSADHNIKLAKVMLFAADNIPPLQITSPFIQVVVVDPPQVVVVDQKKKRRLLRSTMCMFSCSCSSCARACACARPHAYACTRACARARSCARSCARSYGCGCGCASCSSVNQLAWTYLYPIPAQAIKILIRDFTPNQRWAKDLASTSLLLSKTKRKEKKGYEKEQEHKLQVLSQRQPKWIWSENNPIRSNPK